jgi:DHA3 family tetracycline resistance protein-like MFS transporter
MSTRRRIGGLRILRPLGIRDFAFLWTGMTVSLLGDGIYFVTIAWQVYELSNAPTALSIVGLAWTLPLVLFVLLGGVISDRFDRRRVMIIADVLRGLAIAVIGVLAVARELELWHLVVLVAFYGAGEALFMPSFTAIVPDIVPRDLLVEANSLDIFVRTMTARMAGPAIGGVAIGAFGTGGAFLLDAASFGVSALALLAMSSRPLAMRESTSVLADVAEGLRFVRSQTWLWGTLAAASITLLCFYGPWEVLVPFVVKNELDGSARDLGFVFGAGGLGAVLTSLVMSQRSLPRKHITFMYAAWTVSGFAIVGYGVATEIWQAMLAALLAGSLSNAGMIVWMTLMQTRVPSTLLGRVSSLDWFVSIGLIPVSFALTGPIAAAVGVRETLIGAGVLAGCITFAFLFLPGMRDIERDQRPSAISETNA